MHDIGILIEFTQDLMCGHMLICDIHQRLKGSVCVCARTRAVCLFANVCATLPYLWPANIIISSHQFNIQYPGECLCVYTFSHAYKAPYLSQANMSPQWFGQHIFCYIENKAFLYTEKHFFVALNAFCTEMYEFGVITYSYLGAIRKRRRCKCFRLITPLFLDNPLTD